MLPEEVRAGVESVLGRITDVVPVSGGCVSNTVRVIGGGTQAFLKFDASAPAGMFEVEAGGLEALRSATVALRVPEVLGYGEGWLALEWLEAGPESDDADERLGRGLAEMHRAAGNGWGWHRDGFIGPLSQRNAVADGWAEFWGSRRFEPQLRLARDAGAEVGSEADWSRLLAGLNPALTVAEAEGSSLLHGDLWSGNTFVTVDGQPALIDPAAYRGHREVDLAMADLFGGFGPAFARSYREVWPLAPGYAEVRRGIYQLYYLLVHVNLFGGGYTARTRRLLGDVLRELGA